MATIINIREKEQGTVKWDSDLDCVWKSYPETHAVDSNYPIIAKGNIIEGIEANY